MINKKGFYFFTAALLFLCLAVSVSAQAKFEIEKTPIRTTVFRETSEPAVFNFTIKNNQAFSDLFDIYTYAGGVEILPKTSITVAAKESVTFLVTITLNKNVRKNYGFYTFAYSVRGRKSETIEDRFTLKITEIDDALVLSADNINPGAGYASVHLENKENVYIKDMKIKLSSVFFDYSETFDIAPMSVKDFQISLSKERMTGLLAGQYLMTTQLEVERYLKEIESSLKFTEKEGIEADQSSSGVLIKMETITRKNTGNTPNVAEIVVSRNLISRIFTTFNIEPDKVNREGFVVKYSWVRELKPNDSVKVNVKTNYLLPLIILILIIIGVIAIKIYSVTYLKLNKEVVYAKTKGGEFALKVILRVKAKKDLEKVNIVDKLPPIVKLHESFGANHPTKVDLKNRRIEWNIEHIQKGEERIFSYYVFSKMGILGKFELPAATAIYEYDEKIKETVSNRTFFVAEQRTREPED